MKKQDYVRQFCHGFGSFVTHERAEDIYKDIAKRCHKIFDTSNYKLETALPKQKSKK